MLQMQNLQVPIDVRILLLMCSRDHLYFHDLGMLKQAECNIYHARTGTRQARCPGKSGAVAKGYPLIKTMAFETRAFCLIFSPSSPM